MAVHERDLFRAIVLAGTALVTTASGCGQTSPVTDTGPASVDAGNDAAVLVADAGTDAATDGGDAMVLIL